MKLIKYHQVYYPVSSIDEIQLRYNASEPGSPAWWSVIIVFRTTSIRINCENAADGEAKLEHVLRKICEDGDVWNFDSHERWK